MKKVIVILTGLLLIFLGTYAQSGQEEFRIWHFTAVSGEVKSKGFYREYDRKSSMLPDKEKASFINGGLQLNTRSFILHPNFLALDVDGGYFPQASRNNYNVAPDQAEVTNLTTLDLRATLLQQKKVKFITYASFSDAYQNREYLTDLRSNSKLWGSALFYSNRYFPLSLNYHERIWSQKELNTPRKVNMNEKVFTGKTNRSFGRIDNNELSYTHTESGNQNVFSDQDNNFFKINSVIDDVRLTDNIPLDAKRDYVFSSTVSEIDQRGSRKFQRQQFLENLTMRLPKNFTWSNNYNLSFIQQPIDNVDIQNIQSSLSHRAYESLTTRLFVDYDHAVHTSYTETLSKTGGGFNYNKKIPLEGHMTMTYEYFRGTQDMNSGSDVIQITNEQYTLADGQMMLIRRPYVLKESVVVRNITGNITYQQDLDYILIERTPYIEIVRVPGGQITNNAIVFIDYAAARTGTYNYNTDNHAFTINFNLFSNKLEVYYRVSNQEYRNLHNTQFQTLNYFTENVVGTRLDFGFANGGVEYEYYNSSLIPHRMMRYFGGVQKKYDDKVMLSLNANLRDYYLINEKLSQQYSDINGRVTYTLQKQTNLNLDMIYRNQNGRRIDLDLFTARAEIKSVMRKLSFTFGVEVFRRDYIKEIVNFKGTYFSVSRKF